MTSRRVKSQDNY